MAKKRIHQIAKELDIASADILFHAKELGIEVKTASSGLTEEEEQLVKLSLFPEPETESIEETTKVEEDIVESEDIQNTETIEDDNVDIVEITKNSSPNQISKVIDIGAIQIVEDLMSFGIMKAIDTPLEDSEIEQLLEKYNLIVDLIEPVTTSREDIINYEDFEDDADKLQLRAPIITVWDTLIMEKQVFWIILEMKK